MDPLHLAIALGPLAVYLLTLGAINLSRRPFLTTGARDTAALGVGVSGLFFAGPMELFFPEPAFSRFGPYVWLMLLALYGLCLTLVALLLRPRLVIYNLSLEELWPVLGETADALDKEARWAGLNLVLPHLGVSLYVEPLAALRNVQLVSAGPKQNYAGWKRLEVALREALRKTATAPNPYGGSLVFLGVSMVCLVLYAVISQPEAVAAALDEMLRR